jgi:hypothetical protein
MSRLKVARAHGSRNVILVADGTPDDHFAAADLPRVVQRLCAWNDGRSSDGIYFVKDAADGTANAWFFNPDGSPALLCGNGMRAAGHRAGPAVVRAGPRAAGPAQRVRRAGTGWDLHEWRHSGLTHLGEAGASLLMLMAKSRHRKPENVKRYFKPSPEAIAEVTSLLAPEGGRR